MSTDCVIFIKSDISKNVEKANRLGWLLNRIEKVKLSRNKKDGRLVDADVVDFCK